MWAVNVEEIYENLTPKRHYTFTLIHFKMCMEKLTNPAGYKNDLKIYLNMDIKKRLSLIKSLIQVLSSTINCYLIFHPAAVILTKLSPQCVSH